MDRAIPLGRLAGIKVAMSWTVPLIAFVYAFTLAESLLPDRVEAQSASTYWIVGVAGAGLLFLSLLAHEMGHALVGRHEGIGVRGITLTLLGGHTQFVTEPATAGAELRVSAIGPFTNFALAGLFWCGATLVEGSLDGLVLVVGQMFLWLAVLNLILAAVNMLPGAPLDGGAVLEALLWMATRNRNRSASITSVIGIGLGGGLFVLGIVVAREGGAWGQYGIWMLFGGLLIASSARSRLRDAPAIGRLRDTRLGTVMVPDPPVVAEWSTLSDVVARAEAWQPHTAFPVQAPDGRITGLLTSELVLAVDPRDWPVVRAIDVAWPIDRIPTATVDDPVLTALQRADSAGIDRILVVWPDGRVAGTAGRDAARHALRPPATETA
ncbi:MAG TPA: site-2 protease family protein [Iamia sp.]|jgi:Zn-dependent protease|nr:site-2 protease family protein [Iamia sp.]